MVARALSSGAIAVRRVSPPRRAPKLEPFVPDAFLLVRYHFPRNTSLTLTLLPLFVLFSSSSLLARKFSVRTRIMARYRRQKFEPLSEVVGKPSRFFKLPASYQRSFCAAREWVSLLTEEGERAYLSRMNLRWLIKRAAETRLHNRDANTYGEHWCVSHRAW